MRRVIRDAEEDAPTRGVFLFEELRYAIVNQLTRNCAPSMVIARARPLSGARPAFAERAPDRGWVGTTDRAPARRIDRPDHPT
jgi:hypothetical protein